MTALNTRDQDTEKTNKSSILSSIPASRLTWYALLLGCLPILLSILFASHRISEAERLLSSAQEKRQDVLQALQRQSVNRQTIYHYQDKDPFYLNKTVEAYHPLQREKAVLEQLQQYGSLPDFGHQERRYKYLSSGENNFNFIESAAMITPLLKETMEVQSKPVELDIQDLSTVLGYIESASHAENRPQLIVLDGSLERKKGYDQEVWAVSLKLLKRMYTTPISVQRQQQEKTVTSFDKESDAATTGRKTT